MKKNEGEVPQYYIEKSHDAIIDPEEFKLVQLEIARREKIGRNYSGNSIFSSRLICGDCGQFFGSKVWQSNTKYRKTIWQCNDKFKNEHRCETPHLSEDEIKERFMTAFNLLANNRKQLIEDCRLIQNTLTDTAAIEEEIEKLNMEIDIVNGLIRKSIEENARRAVNQAEYDKKYKDFDERYQKLNSRIQHLKDKKDKRQMQHTAIGAFMFEIMELPEPPLSFDEKLWSVSIDHATVYNDGRIVFKFITGAKIEA